MVVKLYSDGCPTFLPASLLSRDMDFSTSAQTNIGYKGMADNSGNPGGKGGKLLEGRDRKHLLDAQDIPRGGRSASEHPPVCDGRGRLGGWVRG